MSAAPSPARTRGPLRLAAAVLLVGVLAVWLVKPIGDACPDLGRLPQGSTASSSPSLSPPLTRTCTYTAAGGTQARARYVPWLDWIVLVLLAGLAGAAARVASPAGRQARTWGQGGPAREQRPARAPRDDRPRRGHGAPRAERPPRGDGAPWAGRERSGARGDAGEREPGDGAPRAGRERSGARGDAGERDAAERERARLERAERARARRDR